MKKIFDRFLNKNKNQNNSIMNKMSDDDILKMKAATLYIVNKLKAVDYFHIFKILYFADREHYAKYGRRIIKDTFCALPNGPVPSNLFDSLKVVTEQKERYPYNRFNLISDTFYSNDSTYAYILSSDEVYDEDELSVSDIECLDKSIEENKNICFLELSDKSHDSAWKETPKNLPINNISIAKAGGADKYMIDYIKEKELIDSLIS